MLIVDAAAQERAYAWSKALSNIGLSWQHHRSTLDQQPLHHAIVRAACLGQGMSAWSLESMQHLFFSNTLPFNPTMFSDLAHPTNPEWTPRPNPTVLEEFARQFHVLGGPGALARWLGVLAQAKPSFAERRPAEKHKPSRKLSGGWAVCFTHGSRCCRRRMTICCATRWWVVRRANLFQCPRPLLTVRRGWDGW